MTAQKPVFGPQLADADVVRILKAALNRPPKSDVFYPVFQAVFDANTKELMGYEALYRLSIPPYDNIPPERFIHLAEKYNLMVELGRSIQKNVFETFKHIHQKHPHLTLSINASIEELSQPKYVDNLIQALDDASLPYHTLCVEITESLLIDRFEPMVKTLNALKANRIKVALDDFGKGYSSLTHLVELKLDIVKIDKYFSRKALEEPQYETFLSGLVFMLRALNVVVIIEGIESEEQFTFFSRLGVHQMQGYYLHEPQTLSELQKKSPQP